jgi:hypothetical protein
MKIVFDNTGDVIAVTAAVAFMLDAIHDSNITAAHFQALHSQLHNVEEQLAMIPELQEFLLAQRMKGYGKEKSHTSVQTG